MSAPVQVPVAGNAQITRPRDLNSYASAVLAVVHTTAAPVRAADSFSVVAVRGTRAYAGGHAADAVTLKPASGSVAGPRAITVVLAAKACPQRSKCLSLAGTLTGTIARKGISNPDVGQQYTLTLHGHLTGIGSVTATGTVDGTGFIRQGREQMRLTLAGHSGTITLSGQSGLVPGFSSP
jgi:hypothetical protein